MTTQLLTMNETAPELERIRKCIYIPPRVETDGPARQISLEEMSRLAGFREESDLSASRLPFVWKLYEMLEEMERTGNEHIVSWSAHGKAFKVHNLKAFVTKIVPMYFKQSKYKSFQRQLYFYGFTRITSGPHVGSYGHPEFIRGSKAACLSIAPVPKKGKQAKLQRADSRASFSSNSSTDSQTVLGNPAACVTRDQSINPDSNADDVSTSLERTLTSNGDDMLVFGGMPFQSINPDSNNNADAVSTSPEGTPSNGDAMLIFGGMPFHFVDTDTMTR
jgi:hypothetical protein